MIDLLAEARARVETGVDPTLLARERAVAEELDKKFAERMKLLRGKPAIEAVAALNRELDRLTMEQQKIQIIVRQTSPRYAALTQPEPIDLKTIQSELLDADTMLLEYSLGETKSFLWAITPDELKSFELPKREIIETQARKVYELLTARNESKAEETPDARRARRARADADYEKEAALLSAMVLAPVAEKIAGKRLLIVADGALQYVSFGALPIPKLKTENQSPQTENQFLIETNEIVMLPSASVLAQLRRDAGERKPAPKTLAVFADPVFSAADARLEQTRTRKKSAADSNENAVAARSVGQNKTAPPENQIAGEGKNETVNVSTANSSLLRSANETNVGADGGGQIPRLPFSRREAENILRLAPAGKKLGALDFAASVPAATGGALADYRIVHFATHGLLNSRHPELSGIVLSLVNENGQPQNGFLRLNDVYNLRLSADLVVLSTCQTALGKDIRGEGLVGLTRGFMYAGAPRVVASLWKVDDAATAELMRVFYEKMLRENLRPAAALRQAQIEIQKQKRFAAPYFWAAFTLQGEWK